MWVRYLKINWLTGNDLAATYDHIVRVLAWMYRFINNLRARGNTDGTCLSEGSKVAGSMSGINASSLT